MIGTLNYLLCKTGMNDIQTKCRTQILTADVELEEGVIHAAMREGEKQGLTVNIPPEEMGTDRRAAEKKFGMQDAGAPFGDKNFNVFEGGVGSPMLPSVGKGCEQFIARKSMHIIQVS